MSKIGWLKVGKTAFFACDIQESFRNSIKTFDNLIAVANRMSAAAKILDVPLIVSEQYPKGLGHTSPAFNKENSSIVYEKTQFSMVTPTLIEHIEKKFPEKLQSVVLFGLETHVCIEQTAMDLLTRNIDVHVLADGCVSRTQPDRLLAFQRLREMGCYITTSENVLFKLLRDKDNPKFKEISRLVREPIPDSLGFDTNTLNIAKL